MPAERRFIVAAVLVAVLLALLGGVLAARSPEFQTVRAAATRRLPALAPLERLATYFAPPPVDVTVSVDTSRRLRSISPLIYGVSVASRTELQATSATLHRWGGNPNTRYNWTFEAWNSARDWEFRNYGGPPTCPSNVADEHGAAINKALGIQTILNGPGNGLGGEGRRHRHTLSRRPTGRRRADRFGLGCDRWLRPERESGRDQRPLRGTQGRSRIPARPA